jgi:predicted nuclease of predicted toxin-antitoxin system
MPLFFADECVAALIVGGLRSLGFDVVDAKEICQGDSDDRALAFAAAASRVLITDDRGFGELAVRHRQPAAGVIILMLYALSSGTRENYAVERIASVANECEGKLVIIEPGRVRTRPIPRDA